MKFLCICLSPAIDATVRMDVWPTDGCVIKNATDTFAPGGKTVNVARWLAIRGAAVACGGLLGEDNAVMFEKELKKYGIEDRFVRIPGSTRVNEMFVTPQGSFKVNRPFRGGPVLSWEDLAFRREGAPETFGARPCVSVAAGDAPETFGARPRAPVSDVVVLSGSLPKEWPADTYRHLAVAAKKAGAKVVLDASGAALVEGVKAHPDVIKPNAEECEPLVGFVPKTPEDFKKATAALKQFCECPIISDGGAGCWFDGTFVAAPKVEVLDTTAAGDTLLAEWCWQTYGRPHHPNTQTLKHSNTSLWAVAAGSAACTMPGGTPPDVEFVKLLKESMK